MLTPATFLSYGGQFITETYSEFGLFHPDKSSNALERKYTLDNSAFIKVDNSRIHYTAEGNPEDPTLLFLHGTYSSLHTWSDWVDEFSDEFHIVRLDMPGFGLTGPQTNGGHTLESLIESISDFADAMELSDVTVAGNSLGGGIAWRLSLDRPDLVSRLVLLDAGGATLLARLAGNLMSFGTDIVPRFITPRVLIRLIVRDAYGDKSKVTPELVRRYHDLLLRPGNRRAVMEIAKSYARDHPAGEADDVYDPRLPNLPSAYNPTPDILDGYTIEEVSVPTLFQWGSEDQWLSVEFGTALADRIPGSQFMVYEGVGHIPMEESPENTAQDARKFIAKTA